MTTKKKPTKKREPREDFNQAAHRIISHVIEKTELTTPHEERSAATPKKPRFSKTSS